MTIIESEKNKFHNLWPNSTQVIDDQQLAELSQRLLPLFETIVQQENLGDAILQQFTSIYLPLAAWLAKKHKKTPVVFGLNGAQGSGKSTLAKILKLLLIHAFNKSVVILSIDDFYLSRTQREQLAKDVHPLLKTRGVPGTHDVELASKTLFKLLNPQVGETIKIPVFNKASDDLLPEKDWIVINNNADIILFEGWCVGAKPQQQNDLEHAINELEKNEDQQGRWRKYINQQLQGPYKSLFEVIDYLLMLKVPDMESVFEWRNLQEQKLEQSCEESNKATSHIMSEKQLTRFIMHYERITRATLTEMSQRADIVLQLNKLHQICSINIKD